jgi:hypothetical protein
MGVQLLKGDKVKAGTTLPEPFGTRLRALVAIADARNAIVPIVARIDSTVTPRMARLHMAFVDAKLATVQWIGVLESPFAGNAAAAADSLALVAARLFVGN